MNVHSGVAFLGDESMHNGLVLHRFQETQIGILVRERSKSHA